MARRRFLFALLLVGLYFGGWFVLGLAVGAGSHSPPQYVDEVPEGISWAVFFVYGALLGVFLGLGGYAGLRLLRQRGVKFRDLDPDEQNRRAEAGRLLHGG